MKILDDKNRGLVWCNLGKIENFDAEDHVYHSDFKKELNSWASHPNFASIEEFILGSKASDFGTFMQRFNQDNRQVFYAFENAEMVGVCVTTGKAYLHDFVKLKMYLHYCAQHKINGVKGCRGVSEIVHAFNNDTGKNNSYIEYIAVKPNLFSKGIGTRMVSSIKNVPTFFFGVNDKSEINLTRTCIHNQNEASKKIFQRNDFLPIFEDYISQSGFREYFNIPNAPENNPATYKDLEKDDSLKLFNEDILII